GFGLGLSIVKGIAGQLDAKLSVGSKPGRGSVFRLTFAKHETLDEKRNQSGATKRALRPSWHGTVLLLEDNTMVANAIGEMMRGWGASVQIFHAPDEAFFSWVEAEIEKVELFITDFNLGEDVADGFEVLAKVHHMVADDEHAPVNVLLTAVARDLIETRWEELEDSGATGDMRFPAVLQKPVDESDLLALLPNEKTSEKIGA
ncbi:MAG: hybrid sensor histidine kinase/response regulator, partial [Sutterella sp.]